MKKTKKNTSEKLAEELQMSRPFASHQHEASLALLVTAERMRTYLNTLCQKHDITSQQYNIMRILRGSFPNALSCSDINNRMIQRSPDLTRLLARLESTGYIVRMRDQKDNRIVRTAILPRGLQLINTMDKTMEESYALFSVLSPKQNKDLLDILTTIRQELYKRQKHIDTNTHTHKQI